VRRGADAPRDATPAAAASYRGNKRGLNNTNEYYFSFHLWPGWLSNRQFRAGGDPAYA
jgi:hypothetical protein